MWKHKKYPSRVYKGTYRFVKGERDFVLFGTIPKSGKTHNISFESHEAAKKLGWVRQ